MEYNFKKVHTGKDLAISFILIGAGAGLFFLNKGLGITIGACGIISLMAYKTGYKLDGKGAVLTKKSEDICRACKSSVVDYLKGKDVTPEIRKGTDGGSFRLDVYFSKDEGVAYAQVFDFCNYAYEPATDVVELHHPKADKLVSQL